MPPSVCDVPVAIPTPAAVSARGMHPQSAMLAAMRMVELARRIMTPIMTLALHESHARSSAASNVDSVAQRKVGLPVFRLPRHDDLGLEQQMIGRDPRRRTRVS